VHGAGAKSGPARRARDLRTRPPPRLGSRGAPYEYDERDDGGEIMSIENKTTARRILEEAFGKGDLKVIDQCIASSHVDHDPANPPSMPNGPAGIKMIVQTYRGAYPDLRMTIDDQIAEGDRVVTRWTARGTHQGPLGEIAPTGRKVTVTGITIDRLLGGKIAESWTTWDYAGMLQQLGAMPRPRVSDTGRTSQPHA
jgi:predicted ester cyclase